MSFKLKTILLFLGISIIPYIFTMFMMGDSFRTEQYKAITEEMNTQLHLTVERIDQHLKTLEKDMKFIANSEIMNVIIDNQISHVLVGKI